MSPLLLLLPLLLHALPPPASSAPISLPLHPTSSPSVSDLALSSLARARHLKKHPNTSIHSRTSISSHSYGGYSLTLAFGTPPQPLPLLLDTGSPLPWLPCTISYLCRSCGPRLLPHFLPKLSLSARLVGCRNPVCSLIHPPPIKCPETQSPNSSALCPPYFVLYGSGSTAGFLLSDSLSLPGYAPQPRIAFGCSLVSDHQPAGGLAGFSRGAVSLPAQLNLSRFSYCLPSRRFDDDPSATGSLTLNGDKDDSTNGVKFTPFLPNPAGNDIFSDYYYVALSHITVGKRKVKISREANFFAPGADGNGGVIIDSGTTFTYMERAAFGPLAEAFAEQVKLKRAAAVEQSTGLEPCFEVPPDFKAAAQSLPQLAFHFKGGAVMSLPLANYFVLVGNPTERAVCLAVQSDGGDGGGVGPAMIMGSFQQQNYYVVYDLEREKLGFRRQATCVAA